MVGIGMSHSSNSSNGSYSGGPHPQNHAFHFQHNNFFIYQKKTEQFHMDECDLL